MTKCKENLTEIRKDFDKMIDRMIEKNIGNLSSVVVVEEALKLEKKLPAA